MKGCLFKIYSVVAFFFNVIFMRKVVSSLLKKIRSLFF